MTPEEKKYVDARNDVLKAAKSIKELTSQQQERLAQEVFGVEAVVAMYKFMRYFWK